ncbi:hypothetical protein DFJ74DRAFT_758344 [Hyaloraphidium curvatum]|nr:hypothetical protein DFJ74DRAFT_758344 [Hyaloraphidium curvatum]
MARLAARLALLFAALAALLALAVAYPADKKEDHPPEPPHPPKKDDGHPPKHHDDGYKKVPVTKTVVVTSTAKATVTATSTLLPTSVPFKWNCSIPIWKHGEHKDGKKGDGKGYWILPSDGKKDKEVIIELPYYPGFGFIYKCDGVYLVFNKKLHEWLLIDLIEVCPIPEPPAKKDDHHYLRRDGKAPPPPKKTDVVYVTQTAVVTATATQTAGVPPPCLPATCELPLYQHDDNSTKEEDGFWYFEHGKEQKIIELPYLKELGAYVYICPNGDIFVFLVKPHKWFRVVLIPVVFPPPPPPVKVCPPGCGEGVYWATGKCVEGKCVCTVGWGGPDCTTPTKA